MKKNVLGLYIFIFALMFNTGILSADLITWNIEQIGGIPGRIGGAPTASTSSLRITFSGPVELAQGNVSIIGGFGVTGAITGAGTVWTIPVSMLNQSEYAFVIINKAGVEKGPKTVLVYYRGSRPPVNYTVVTNGKSGTPVTALIFTFSEQVSLSGDQINILAGTGSIKKESLSGGGTTWTLGINIEHHGDLMLQITNPGITSTLKSVTLFKYEEILANTITISSLSNFKGRNINILLFGNYDDFINESNAEIFAQGQIDTGGSALLSLKTRSDNESWTGSDSYYISFRISGVGRFFNPSARNFIRGNTSFDFSIFTFMPE